MKPPASNLKSKDILRALMDPAGPDPVPWSATELTEILQHQLDAPLSAEQDRFANLADCPKARVADLIAASGCRTFGDVLRHHAPSVEILKMIKDFAKAAIASPDDLPADVARVLYVLAILPPRQPAATRLTTLDDASLMRQVRRCLTYAWLPEHTRVMLRNGIKNLDRA